MDAFAEPKVWKNGEKFYWKSQNQFAECVSSFCREGPNAGKPGPCPKDPGGKIKAEKKLGVAKVKEGELGNRLEESELKERALSKETKKLSAEWQAKKKELGDKHPETKKALAAADESFKKQNEATKATKSLSKKYWTVMQKVNGLSKK